MQSIDAPKKISIPFSRDGAKRSIPNTSQIGVVNGAASYPTGFPPLTFISKTDGGIPPDGEDFNGVLYDITAIQRWQSSGGMFKFDADLSNEIGGYPKGALIVGDDNLTIYQSLSDNNVSNPNLGGSAWDTLNTSVFPNYAAMSSYTGPKSSFYVSGGIIGGQPDGTAGFMIHDPADTTSVIDNGTVFASAKGGRIKRVFSGPIEVDWFGAYGATDCKAAVTLAIAAAQRLPHGGTVAFRQGANYRTLSGWSWNSTLVGFDGRRCFIDCRSVPPDTIILMPTQFGVDDNERVGAAQMHPMENFIFRGPGYSATTTVWLRIDAPPTELVNAGNTFKSITVQSFAVDVQLQRGAFFTTFSLMDFQGINGSGVDTTKPIQISTGVNNGERTTFENCLMGNRNFLFDQTNPNADTLFLNCSMNFPGQNIATISAGMVTMIGCHTEGISDIDRWIQVSGQDTLLNITNHHLVVNASKVNFSPFYSDPSCTRGGIVINGLKITSQILTVNLVDGGGRAKGGNISYSNNATQVLFSLYQNRLSYPSFESADYTADWVRSGTQTPMRVNTVTAQSGAWSLEFAPLPAAPIVASAYADVSCRPGDFVALEFWYTTVGLAATGGTFFASGRFVDKAGNLIGTEQGILATQDNVGAWTKIIAGSPIAAPAGTHGFRLFFSLFGTTSGTPKGYIDSVAITVS